MAKVTSLKEKENMKILSIVFISDNADPPAYEFEATDWRLDEFGMLHLYSGKDQTNIINMQLVLWIEIGEKNESKT
jgi:hypothetical protein